MTHPQFCLENIHNCLVNLSKGLTLEYLQSIPDQDLAYEIQDYYFKRIEQAVAEEDSEFVSRVSPALRDVALIYEVHSQVSNGGFNQYLFNSGNHAEQALEALIRLCGDKHAEPLKSVLASVTRKSIHDEVRKSESTKELLQKFSESYSSLNFGEEDSRWYKLDRDREQTLNSYVRNNPDQFILDDTCADNELSSPLDIYFDEYAFNKQNVVDSDWDDKDIPASRSRRLLRMLEVANDQFFKDDYVASLYLLTKLLAQAERWDLFQTPRVLEAAHRCVLVLEKLNRPVQTAALKKYLEDFPMEEIEIIDVVELLEDLENIDDGLGEGNIVTLRKGETGTVVMDYQVAFTIEFPETAGSPNAKALIDLPREKVKLHWKCPKRSLK